MPLTQMRIYPPHFGLLERLFLAQTPAKSNVAPLEMVKTRLFYQ